MFADVVAKLLDPLVFLLIITAPNAQTRLEFVLAAVKAYTYNYHSLMINGGNAYPYRYQGYPTSKRKTRRT